MTNLNEQVAVHIMGWDGMEGRYYMKGEGYVDFANDHNGFDPMWNPSEDMNHCRMAEKRMEERGLMAKYVEALYHTAFSHLSSEQLILLMPEEKYNDYLFYLVTASPTQRCEAMLKAVGGSR